MKKCLNCESEVIRKVCKFCSRKCYIEYGDKTFFKKGHPPYLEQNGAKNNKWRGDEVSYSSLHHWVRNNYGHALRCEHCLIKGTKKTGRWNIEWANKTGKYLRDISDWIGLCTKCHRAQEKTLTTKRTF